MQLYGSSSSSSRSSNGACEVEGSSWLWNVARPTLTRRSWSRTAQECVLRSRTCRRPLSADNALAAGSSPFLQNWKCSLHRRHHCGHTDKCPIVPWRCLVFAGRNVTSKDCFAAFLNVWLGTSTSVMILNCNWLLSFYCTFISGCGIR